MKYGTILEEHPEFVKFLCNKDDANIHIGSAKKVDWICPNCGGIVREKSVNKVISRNRIPCSICCDGVSKPEKIVASALRQMNVEYVPQKCFKWSGKKRYDFFLPKHNTILEVHGSQHYGYGFRDFSGVSIEDQIATDNKKKDLAIKNGIKNYFVINAADTSAIPILSQLSPLLLNIGICGVINYKMCEAAAMTSNVRIAADMWNEGMSSGEISGVIGVGASCVIGYLKTAASIGLCNYTPYIGHVKSQIKNVEKLKRKIICTTTGEIFPSLADAKRKYHITSASNIIRACKNNNKHAGEINGVKLSWRYYE